MRVSKSKPLVTFSKNVADDLFANQAYLFPIYNLLKYLILILNDPHFM